MKESIYSFIIKVKLFFTRITKHGDRNWYLLLLLTAILILSLLGGILYLLWRDSASARNELGWNFLRPTLDAS